MIGKKVSITLQSDKTIQGIATFENDDTIFLKLASGYNIGKAYDQIKDQEIIADVEPQSDTPRITQDDDLPSVHIVHTGGTIASKIDYSTGAVTNAYEPEELLQLVPEAQEMASLSANLLMNVSSENLRFEDINTIAKHVHDKIVEDSIEGIVITVGTDMLHYVSAALSFMLGIPPIPVIVVGSQRSSDRPSSDGPDNLLCALSCITKTNWNGIGVCMHGPLKENVCLLHRGTRVRKNHTSRRDAFQSINDSVAGIIDRFNYEPLTEMKAQKPDLRCDLLDPEINIGWLKVRPNMSVPKGSYDALLIEGTGLGHMPTGEHTKNSAFYNYVKEFAKEKPVVMTSQTINGRLNMNVYSNGRKIRDLGVYGHGLDIIPETAYMKIAWLLSHHRDSFELYEANIVGEISPSSKVNTYEL